MFKLVNILLKFSKAQIDASKMFLHEGYCLRNNKYCEKCGTAVEIANWDEHVVSHDAKKVDNQSTPVKVNPSEINNNIVNKPVINPSANTANLTNKNIANSMKQNCKYCSLQLSKDELVEHESHCGARSTKCEYCNTNVLVKELNSHYMLCDAKMAIDELQNEAFMEDQFGKILPNILVDVPKEDVPVNNIPLQNKEADDIMAKKLQMELDEQMARE
jgi:DNA-directed RNA polymerase subunit RPC12/RpoP